MNEKARDLSEHYAAALQDYLSAPEEAGLMRAYDLGRHAMMLAVGVPELAMIHGRALGASLAALGKTEERVNQFPRAAQFLAEALAPFEMVQRGYREANDSLKRMNEKLEWRVRERTAALQESEERYRDLFENAGDMIQGAAPDGRLLYVNRAWRGNLGFDKEEIARLSIADIVHSDHKVVFLETCRRALGGENIGPTESVFVAKDGRSIVVEGTVSSRFVDGKPVATQGIFRDITQRKQMEEELKEAARRKDEFLAILAHELRNPLAPVRNSLQIMQLASHDSVVVGRAREMMDRQLRILVRLIDDLMDVSRISRGKIELRKERLDLADVVTCAVEISTPLIDAGRHQLTVTLPNMPVYLDADQARLAQVLANLLNNAAKYTEPGGKIFLTAEREGGQAVVRVRDTGVGVSKDMLPRLFDLFVQVSSSKERSQGGLGIGLTLVKTLVEMHGGSVEAHSPGPGQGCEFVVRLPIPADAQETDQGKCAQETSTTPLLGALRVMVVDDNQASAESLGMLMKIEGHQVAIAYDGLVALESVLAFQPSIMLLDIEMPHMSGFEVARQIRANPATKDVLLVAMTGYGSEEDRRRCRQAGFDHHLVKPVDFDDLHRLMATLDRQS